MQFEDLIRLSNRLADMTIQDLKADTVYRYHTIMHESNIPSAEVDNVFRQQITITHDSLQKTFLQLEQNLDEFKSAVKNEIRKEGNTWLQRSYTRYEQQLETGLGKGPSAPELHRNKPIYTDADILKMFNDRVGSYSNWHYPAAIIHPMMEPFIHNMVGSDPLYVLDESHYLLDPVLAQFNSVYQRRVRPYIIEESFERPILSALPDDQFGFCFVYNYLNYRPFELIKKYISESYKKLKPGGVLVFTFNDCDRWQSIQLVEQEISCYTPGSLITGWSEYVGFKEIYRYQDQTASVWLELQKPGTLLSLRGGQNLAKILPKPVANSK
jgi:SAM-dependent methyltransferase